MYLFCTKSQAVFCRGLCFSMRLPGNELDSSQPGSTLHHHEVRIKSRDRVGNYLLRMLKWHELFSDNGKICFQ